MQVNFWDVGILLPNICLIIFTNLKFKLLSCAPCQFFCRYCYANTSNLICMVSCFISTYRIWFCKRSLMAVIATIAPILHLYTEIRSQIMAIAIV